MESTLEQRLGRRLDPRLADIGRLLWFDVAGGLHSDNTCGGCHSPTNGMGDTQSIAIGIQNNGVVGMHRTGPRNQRRTPAAINAAFYPRLMWNGRFSSNSGDPFDNSLGFHFPPPEGDTKFPANDPIITHLLIAQAHIPQPNWSKWPDSPAQPAQLAYVSTHLTMRRAAPFPPQTPPVFVTNQFVKRTRSSQRKRQLASSFRPDISSGQIWRGNRLHNVWKSHRRI